MKEKFLGVDFGDARTGLALSESTGLLAVGAGCIRCGNLRKTAEQVAAFAKEQAVARIIIGKPLNMNGTEGPRCERVRAFAGIVAEESGLPVELFDERLTTVSAHRFLSDTGVNSKKRKNSVDELSATLILQDYLDRNRNKT
jgi:putative Holliday junction resolvase